MNAVLAITGRNLRLFFRDPLGVFFSLLGALIIFLLYALFLGNLQVLSITQSAPGLTEDDVRGFVDAWMFAGIVAITTMTTPLGAMNAFVEDAASGRFRDFLVSPIRRGQLTLGYLLSAFAIGVILTAVVLLVAVLYLGIFDGMWLEVGQVLGAFGIAVLSVAAFAALWSFVVSFVRTTGAFSALSTIIGTVAGFVGGAYLAMGLIPETVRDVLSALPFAQTAMLLRQEFAADALDALLAGAPEQVTGISEFYGITLSVGDWAVPGWFVIAVLAAMTVVFAVAAAVRIRSRIR